VNRPLQPQGRQLWKSLSEAGLVDPGPEEFPQRIKDAKRAVVEGLDKLFKLETDIEERRSAARCLGTLRTLETKLNPNPDSPSTNKRQ